MALDHTRAATVLEQAIAARVFPGAAAEVGAADGILWRGVFGTLSFDAASPRVTADTLFDLASLTKPVATTSVVMQLCALGDLEPDDLVSSCFSEWRGVDRENVTIRDLLEHASGLAPRLTDRPPSNRREFEHEICTMPLEYEPRSKSVYSDLGFILLGFLAADRGGATLDALFAAIGARVTQGTGPVDEILMFRPDGRARARAAPTRPLEEDERRGRSLVGEVHDNYAARLRGVAGHAGLFGTVAGVGAFARAALNGARGNSDAPSPLSPTLMSLVTSRSTVPSSSRAFGWDTMLPTSSCGTRMSPRAFGHVGFTGCSLWIDPPRDRYFVLLTNRACGDGTLDQMREVRRAFHDALTDR